MLIIIRWNAFILILSTSGAKSGIDLQSDCFLKITNNEIWPGNEERRRSKYEETKPKIERKWMKVKFKSTKLKKEQKKFKSNFRKECFWTVDCSIDE